MSTSDFTRKDGFAALIRQDTLRGVIRSRTVGTNEMREDKGFKRRAGTGPLQLFGNGAESNPWLI